ncbi:LAQU0S04e04280g1_1 [Lachancea quebecensis]|uniref:Nucleolar protein 16 n=1 Tax=Lachancea quebecensis TaxID=1654605 RepID=A0A0P1KQQ7_9SACH|nr:LAQU0S04e04280g1_1 [Lachancea quebecensis]
MASVRRRKMAKSSVKKATRKLKNSSRKVNITGNPIIAKNWDHSLTLSQNYEKLGLRSKLQDPAGGKEASLEKVIAKEPLAKTPFSGDSDEEWDSDSDNSTRNAADDVVSEENIPLGEARILRDNEGNVLKIVYGKKDVGGGDESSAVVSQQETTTVKELKAFAARPVVTKVRTPSEREELWLKSLYEKHGDDYRKMFFDKKLNVMQQTEADIRKRVIKWKLRNKISD